MEFTTADFINLYSSLILTIPVFIIAFYSYRLQKESHSRVVEKEESNYLWEIDDMFGQLKITFTAIGNLIDSPQMYSLNNWDIRLAQQNDRCFEFIENGNSPLSKSELRRFAYVFSHVRIIAKNYDSQGVGVDIKSVEKFIKNFKQLLKDYEQKLDKIDNSYEFY